MRDIAPAELPPLPCPLHLADTTVFDRWIATMATQIGVEAEPVQVRYGDLPALVQGAAPAILHLPGAIEEGAPLFLLLVKGGQRHVTLLTPTLQRRRVLVSRVCDAFSHALVTPHRAALLPLLGNAGLSDQQLAQAARVILAEQLGTQPLQGCWLLRYPPHATGWQQITQIGLLRPSLSLVGGYVLYLGLTLTAWWLIGRSVLMGTFNQTWLLGWGLLLLTAVVVQAWASSTQAQLAVDVGAWVKQRLLQGTLQLEPEQIRHQGAGQFLGRILDAESTETLGLASGFWGLLAVVQLGSAAVILSLGVGGWGHVLLLVSWFLLLLVLGWLLLRRQQRWSEAYRSLTNDLVEQMIGHRTRLAQADAQQWHQGEDAALAGYLKQSARFDQLRTLMVLIPRGWMVVALLVLFAALLVAPGNLTGFAITPGNLTTIAITLGGMILALQAFSSCVTGLQALIGARIAWRQTAPLLQAATHQPTPPNPAVRAALEQPVVEAGQPLLLARDLTFHYRGAGNPVLRGCNLQIRHGDRLLLEGPSGGGKSTLAALLAGLRVPSGGLLLWRGFDGQTLGSAAWREQVVAAPQFHENHVLTGTLAFNLLMGRGWPPSPADLATAETICRELGLGELIDRMPAGLQQMVGESGWQLSHGERSRLYIARALLQQAELLILDESFASLDPASMQQAFQCVERHAPTLLVIAHP